MKISPSQPFVEGLKNNLAYWHGRIDWPNENLVIDHGNLLQAILFGRMLTETRTTTFDLMLKSFALIEQWGQWSTWLPIFSQAVKISRSDKQLLCAQLLNRYGRWLCLNRQLDEAVASHLEAIELATQTDNQMLLAEAFLNLGDDYLRQHKYSLSEKYGKQSLKIFRQLNSDTKFQAAALNLLGLNAFEQGMYEKAVDQLRNAATLWKTCNDLTQQAQTLKNLGFALQRDNQPHAALNCYQEALDCLNQSASPLAWIELQNNLGILYYNWEQYDKAARIFRQANRAARRLKGAFQITASLAQNLGSVLLQQTRFKEAAVQLQRAKILWTQFNNNLELANTLGSLGDVHVSLNEFEIAAQFYNEALVLLKSYPENAWANKLRQEFSRKQIDLIDKSA